HTPASARPALSPSVMLHRVISACLPPGARVDARRHEPGSRGSKRDHGRVPSPPTELLLSPELPYPPDPTPSSPTPASTGSAPGSDVVQAAQMAMGWRSVQHLHRANRRDT
uniref:Uncharacterized protein n=1 Tax=Aegilops tauschii subsp. strangulata TaxID=200361 RepID=A0A452XSE1_AEGTS